MNRVDSYCRKYMNRGVSKHGRAGEMCPVGTISVSSVAARRLREPGDYSRLLYVRGWPLCPGQQCQAKGERQCQLWNVSMPDVYQLSEGEWD
jgi:hypothetical protein